MKQMYQQIVRPRIEYAMKASFKTKHIYNQKIQSEGT